MNLFKTPEEAIAACNAVEETAWKSFTDVNNIKEETDNVAYAITRKVFHAGFASGAGFVSNYIVSNMRKHAQNPVIQPDPQTE